MSRSRRPASPRSFPYPWPGFLAATAAIAVLPFAHLEIAGVLAICLSALGVYADARRRRIPRPDLWAISTLIIWPMIFPFYLVRRRQPGRACPEVEANTRFLPGLGVIAVVFLLLAVLMLLADR